MSNFLLEIKSTIDRLAVDVAEGLGIARTHVVDLDDTVTAAELVMSAEPCLLIQYATLDEDPCDPFYSVVFGIGAKTRDDPANYDLITLLSAIKDVFSIGDRIEIKDWSGAAGAVPARVEGVLTLTQVGMNEQLFDKESGLRLIQVVARAVRHVAD